MLAAFGELKTVRSGEVVAYLRHWSDWIEEYYEKQ
jgi:hypothetical protein